MMIIKRRNIRFRREINCYKIASHARVYGDGVSDERSHPLDKNKFVNDTPFSRVTSARGGSFSFFAAERRVYEAEKRVNIRSQ